MRKLIILLIILISITSCGKKEDPVYKAQKNTMGTYNL
tara:strand:+ start:16162 stop:16275 length:114 start_codon:yes stop_codon:yes gene_type:complete